MHLSSFLSEFENEKKHRPVWLLYDSLFEVKTARNLKAKNQKRQDPKELIDAYRKQFAKSLKHISIEEINEWKSLGRR